MKLCSAPHPVNWAENFHYSTEVYTCCEHHRITQVTKHCDVTLAGWRPFPLAWSFPRSNCNEESAVLPPTSIPANCHPERSEGSMHPKLRNCPFYLVIPRSAVTRNLQFCRTIGLNPLPSSTLSQLSS